MLVAVVMCGAFDYSSVVGEHSVLWLAALLAAVASLPRFDEQPNLVAVLVQVGFHGPLAQ